MATTGQRRGRASAGWAFGIHIGVAMLELVVEAHVMHALEDFVVSSVTHWSMASSAFKRHCRSMAGGRLVHAGQACPDVSTAQRQSVGLADLSGLICR